MLLSDGLSGQFMTGIVRLKEVWFGNSLKGGVKENQKQKEESPKSETLATKMLPKHRRQIKGSRVVYHRVLTLVPSSSSPAGRLERDRSSTPLPASSPPGIGWRAWEAKHCG